MRGRDVVLGKKPGDLGLSVPPVLRGSCGAPADGIAKGVEAQRAGQGSVDVLSTYAKKSSAPNHKSRWV
jgi:hypothetical protein